MLVGLTGQLGTGKDSVYHRASAMIPNAERIAFADKLKLAAARALGVTVDVLENAKRDENTTIDIVEQHEEEVGFDGDVTYHQWVPAQVQSITVRKYLQLFGTEVGRDTFGENFWVEQALPNDFNHEGRVVFVTDCRFENEANQVRKLGGTVIRVLNGPLLTPEHASEQILPDSLIDGSLDNSIRNDDFVNLDNQVRALLVSLGVNEVLPVMH
jgi:hypothetical protein